MHQWLPSLEPLHYQVPELSGSNDAAQIGISSHTCHIPSRIPHTPHTLSYKVAVIGIAPNGNTLPLNDQLVGWVYYVKEITFLSLYSDERSHFVLITPMDHAAAWGGCGGLYLGRGDQDKIMFPSPSCYGLNHTSGLACKIDRFPP